MLVIIFLLHILTEMKSLQISVDQKMGDPDAVNFPLETFLHHKTLSFGN